MLGTTFLQNVERYTVQGVAMVLFTLVSLLKILKTKKKEQFHDLSVETMRFR